MSETAPEDLPALVGKLAEAQALVLLRLRTPDTGQDGKPDELLSLPEVARILGIPEDRADELGRRRAFPVVRVGQYRRVRKGALLAYVGAQEVGAVTREHT